MRLGGKYYLELVRSEIESHHKSIGGDFKKVGHLTVVALLEQLTGAAAAAKDPWEQQAYLLAISGLYHIWLPLLEKDG